MMVSLQFQSKAKQFPWRERRRLVAVCRHRAAQPSLLGGETAACTGEERPRTVLPLPSCWDREEKSQHRDDTLSVYQALSWAAWPLFQNRTDDCLCLQISMLQRRTLPLLRVPLPSRTSAPLWPSILGLSLPTTCQSHPLSLQSKNYMHNFIECTMFLS